MSGISTYNVAIRVRGEGQQRQEALQHLRTLQRSAIVPHVIIYNAAFRLCVKATQCRLIRPDVITYKAASSACERGVSCDCRSYNS